MLKVGVCAKKLGREEKVASNLAIFREIRSKKRLQISF